MRVIVIGSGATGLASAYLLARQGIQVVVLEAAATVGGLLGTFEVSPGCPLERFYHHFFTHDAEINWLLDELGLHERVRFRPGTMGVYRDGRSYPFNGPPDVLRFAPLGWLDRCRFALSAGLLVYLARYVEAEDVPALAWFRAWAGEKATGAIWQPLLRVKFGEAAERVPLAWMAGRLRQRARSRHGTQEQLGYLDGSLQVLVDALVNELTRQGVALRTRTPVERLLTDGRAVVGVSTPQGDIGGDAVIATLPTPLLARLVEPHDARYAAELARIKYLGALCTVLALRQALSSVYWLNVADAGFDFGGVIEHTNLVPPTAYAGQHLVYLSRYLDCEDELWKLDDEALVSRQLDQLGRMFRRDVRRVLVRSWVFRGRYAAPVTELGFHRLIPRFRAPLTNLFVGSMPHIYPDERSVNNSIRVAAEVVRTLTGCASPVPTHLSLAAKYGHD